MPWVQLAGHAGMRHECRFHACNKKQPSQKKFILLAFSGVLRKIPFECSGFEMNTYRESNCRIIIV